MTIQRYIINRVKMNTGSCESGFKKFVVIARSSASSISTNPVLVETSSTPVIWSKNETKALLEKVNTSQNQEYKLKVGTSAIKNLKKLWEILVQENKLLKMNVTPNHTENRWRVLERAYKKHLDNQNKTGQGPGKRYFEYIEEMDEIFKGKKNVDPVVLLSSATIETISDDDEPEVAEGTIDGEKPPKLTAKTFQKKEHSWKHKRTPITNRNLTLAHMREDRKEYQEARLSIEREKLEVQKRKAEAMEERNKLLKERNEILKTKKCLSCFQE